jgi:alkaline phosphatase D
MKRRLPLLALAIALALPASAMAKGSFSLGVSNGDVTARSAILWAHTTRAGTVTLEVSGNKRFRGALKRKRLHARAGADNTVQSRVTGLKPGTRYWFRFRKGRSRSNVGSFRTAPSSSSNKTIRFAWSGDEDATPAPGQTKAYWNQGQVFSRMVAERNDFNINLGDTIYSDTEVPGHPEVALTVPQKWAKYRLIMGLKPLQRLRATAPYYAHWDDHEFINDFSPAESSFLGSDRPVVNEDGHTLYTAGQTAFRDYQPVTYSKANGIYRSFRWGRNLEVFMLDERSFRSAKASANHACDNPQTGQPDLAPTAPAATRALFAAVVPSLAQPVSAGCLAAINDPNRTFLGARQLARFESAIKRSKATFKVIMTEMEIKQYYALPYDRWEGYEAERQKLLTFLRDNVKNVVFLATDVHATLAVNARLKTLEQGGPVDSGILEVSTGPVATRNFALEIDAATGSTGNGALVRSAFLKPPPPNGIGMQCANIDTFSYGEVTVTSNKLTIAPKDINGRALKDGDAADSPACGPFTLTRK